MRPPETIEVGQCPACGRTLHMPVTCMSVKGSRGAVIEVTADAAPIVAHIEQHHAEFAGMQA